MNGPALLDLVNEPLQWRFDGGEKVKNIGLEE
jgi:hypothetical protein